MLVGRVTNLGRCGVGCTGAGPSACGIGPFTRTLGAISRRVGHTLPERGFRMRLLSHMRQSVLLRRAVQPARQGVDVAHARILRDWWRPPAARRNGDHQPADHEHANREYGEPPRSGIARGTKNTGTDKPREPQTAELGRYGHQDGSFSRAETVRPLTESRTTGVFGMA